MKNGSIGLKRDVIKTLKLRTGVKTGVSGAPTDACTNNCTNACSGGGGQTIYTSVITSAVSCRCPSE
jgi:hypothetical protein